MKWRYRCTVSVVIGTYRIWEGLGGTAPGPRSRPELSWVIRGQPNPRCGCTKGAVPCPSSRSSRARGASPVARMVAIPPRPAPSTREWMMCPGGWNRGRLVGGRFSGVHPCHPISYAFLFGRAARRCSTGMSSRVTVEAIYEAPSKSLRLCSRAQCRREAASELSNTADVIESTFLGD